MRIKKADRMLAKPLDFDELQVAANELLVMMEKPPKS